MALSKNASNEFLVTVKSQLEIFINKERCGSCKIKECKRSGHKLVEEIKKNMRQPDFKKLQYKYCTITVEIT